MVLNITIYGTGAATAQYTSMTIYGMVHDHNLPKKSGRITGVLYY